MAGAGARAYSHRMCRNIKTLYNFDPPVTDEEIHASALQYVRKVSGFTRPSKANEVAFDRAVLEVSRVTRELVDALETKSPPRDREVEAARARARGLARQEIRTA
jgi:hypothetical protein